MRELNHSLNGAKLHNVMQNKQEERKEKNEERNKKMKKEKVYSLVRKKW